MNEKHATSVKRQLSFLKCQPAAPYKQSGKTIDGCEKRGADCSSVELMCCSAHFPYKCKK